MKKENDDEFDYFVEGGTTNFLEIDKNSSQVSAWRLLKIIIARIKEYKMKYSDSQELLLDLDTLYTMILKHNPKVP